MATVLDAPLIAAEEWTAADLVERFGPISLSRICFDPLPGRASVADAVRFTQSERGLFELFDGVLVAKPMGALESILAVKLGRRMDEFVEQHQLGVVLGEAGMLELLPQQVRMADVAYVSYKRLADSGYPEKAAPTVGPELAVEILSPGNTPEEMDLKLHDYFAAGAQLVWYIDPRQRTVNVYSAVEAMVTLAERDVLDGGEVLPGFTIELKPLFDLAWRSGGP
jgi:Uma2 family endonuclease